MPGFDDPAAGGRLLRFAPGRIAVSVDAVARYYGGAGYNPDSGTRREIQDVIAAVSATIAPSAFHRRLRVTGVRRDAILLENGAKLPVPVVEQDPAAAFLVAGVLTLGAPFDDFYQTTARSGDPGRAMMADAAGVSLLESLSLHCLSLYHKEACTLGLRAGCFFGPGYGDYPLEGQKQLFDLIGPAPVGVRLLPSMVMVPLKSLSFFLFYGPNENRRSRLSKCRRCHLHHCLYWRSGLPPAVNNGG